MFEYMASGVGFMGYMSLFWIIPLVLIIWLLVVVLDGKKDKSKTAMDILQERYARGEIDQQEYEQKKNELRI